jgi:hypothetical protein
MYTNSPIQSRETVFVKFLDSPIHNLGHYINSNEYKAKLKLIEKVDFIRECLDVIYTVRFSFFWKVPIDEAQVNVCDLVALRHKLVAPDMYACHVTEHDAMLDDYIRQCILPDLNSY